MQARHLQHACRLFAMSLLLLAFVLYVVITTYRPLMMASSRVSASAATAGDAVGIEYGDTEQTVTQELANWHIVSRGARLTNKSWSGYINTYIPSDLTIGYNAVEVWFNSQGLAERVVVVRKPGSSVGQSSIYQVNLKTMQKGDKLW